MKSLKSEKGAITIIALVSMLFILSFLMSAYMITSNKAQKQSQISKEIQAKYTERRNLNEIYNSYFKNDIIPIYNEEQLLQIGTGNELEIDGNYYKMTWDGTYALMESFELEKSDWVPINSDTNFTGYFQGNGNTITVTDISGEVSIYSELNNYSIQPEITFKEERISLSVRSGEETTATLTVESKNIDEKNKDNIRWSSSNPEIVRIIGEGQTVTISCNTGGFAIITARYEENGKAYEATCSVVVGWKENS